MNESAIPQKYIFSKDLSKEYLEQIVGYAKTDDLVIGQTSDAVRFSSLEKAERWVDKTQKVFLTLSTSEKELVGIIWFERLDLPSSFKEKSNWTLGIRIYEQYRGNSLSLPFMKKAFVEFSQLFPNESVWLSTKNSNQIAQKIYKKFGFTEIGEVENKKYYIFKL